VTSPETKGPGSRKMIFLLLVGTLLVAILPAMFARTRRAQRMRVELTDVLAQCRARYDAARTPADTAAADAWQPPLHGDVRPGDPPCGPYRRRNMLGHARP
jgi:type II secretory pathway pseudopilin PulG